MINVGTLVNVPRELTPEGRERLSKLAKERHRNGNFGGAQPGSGRPKSGSKKKQRITKRVAEAAMEEANAKSIVQVFKDAIHPGQPMHVRLKGAQAWAEIAQQSAKFDLQEEAQSEAVKSRDELISILAGKLTSGPTAQIIRGQLERETGIVDAEVVEEEADGDSLEAA